MTAVCEVCLVRKPYKSSIINGKYYADLCSICETLLRASQSPSSGAADWARGRDYEDNLHEIVQPYTDGHANPLFIQAYPDKARAMFTEDELRKYG